MSLTLDVSQLQNMKPALAFNFIIAATNTFFYTGATFLFLVTKCEVMEAIIEAVWTEQCGNL